LYLPAGGPIATKYAFGLQSVAQLVESTDSHEFIGGVQWDADCPHLMTAMASLICDPRTGKVLPEFAADAFADALPFRGYDGLQCKLPGREDLLIRARNVFDLAEWPFIEDQAWAGTANGLTRFLADGTATDLTPVPGTAISLMKGVGLLQEWLANVLGQIGTLWSPRQIAPYWARDLLATKTGGTMLDPLSNKIVFSAGGGNKGPGTPPVAPALGKYWLYATGPVMVRRSDVYSPDLEEALDRVENLVFALFERQYLVGWACDQAQVLVDPTLP